MIDQERWHATGKARFVLQLPNMDIARISHLENQEDVYSSPIVKSWATENLSNNEITPPLACASRQPIKDALVKDEEDILALRERLLLKKAHAAQKRAWLAPIRVIPVEILCLIFAA